MLIATAILEHLRQNCFVSIPHRDLCSLQQGNLDVVNEWWSQFQSLIGIYAHCNAIAATVVGLGDSVFQSLIGIYAHCNALHLVAA